MGRIARRHGEKILPRDKNSILDLDPAVVQEVLNKHADTFRKLAKSEAKEKPLATMAPTPMVVRQEIIHVPGVSISKPDHRARKYAKELNTRLNEKVDVAVEMIDDRFKHHAIQKTQIVDGMKLISSTCEISRQKISELTKSVEELKARKPEEKQIVIEKPVQSKLMLIGLGISLALNVLILIIK